MADDPLYQPLKLPAARAASHRPRWALWAALVLVAVGAAAGGTALLRGRDRPVPAEVAVAPIELAPAPAPPPPGPPAVAAAASPAAAPDPSSPGGGSVEFQHGVKIIRLGAAASPASVALPVPEGEAVALSRAPNPRLVEPSRFGPLPRIGADGSRPADVYARPASPLDGPSLAIVVGDLGRNQMLTAQAARRLPPAITFAFPPDAPDLATQVAEARAAGHEVILQLPAEAASAGATPDEAAPASLLRLLGRATGYAGVSLAPGGDPAVREAAAGEIRRRGLYLLDTAAAPAGKPPPGPATRGVDVTLSADAGAPALEPLAAHVRAHGRTVGWIAGPGADPEALASFAEALGAQHIGLVPLSALVDHATTAARALK